MSPRTFLYMRWDDLRPGPARRALERFFDPATGDVERVRLARKVLSLDAPAAHCMLFDTYRSMCMNARFGPSNPLDEILGILRVRALAVLRRPAGPRGERHAAAIQVVADAARPKDIPLLLSLLDRPTHLELPSFIYWALTTAVQDLEAAHPALIEAMEKRLPPGREACAERFEASRVLDAHRVPESEAALSRALPRLSPVDAIPVATALLSHDPVRHLDVARRVRDGLPAGYPRDEDQYDGMGWQFTVFKEAIEEAEQGGVAEMAARARLAEVKARLAEQPDPPLAALLEGLRPEDCTALTPTLCRLLGAAGDAAAPEILRALGRRPAAIRTFFHAIEPWLSHPDLQIRRLAMRAVLASRSDQARARLLTRLRRSCLADAADACTLLEALAAEHPLGPAEAAPALASPFPEVRALAERRRVASGSEAP